MVIVGCRDIPVRREKIVDAARLHLGQYGPGASFRGFRQGGDEFPGPMGRQWNLAAIQAKGQAGVFHRAGICKVIQIQRKLPPCQHADQLKGFGGGRKTGADCGRGHYRHFTMVVASTGKGRQAQ